MTCEDARERLSDHLLGTLDPAEDKAIRGHLRGCASCRGEMNDLADGVAAFAAAAHDRRPPDDLKDRVLGVLQEEWREPSVAASDEGVAARSLRRPRWQTLVAVAASIALVASLAWGANEHRRAGALAEAGSSYQHLLSTLGGKEFRTGRLQAAGPQAVDGSVVVYDSSHDQSWAAVFVRAPGLSGSGEAILHSPDGHTVRIWPLRLQYDGAGAAWVVTASDLSAYDRVTITAADGSLLATAPIASV